MLGFGTTHDVALDGTTRRVDVARIAANPHLEWCKMQAVPVAVRIESNVANGRATVNFNREPAGWFRLADARRLREHSTGQMLRKARQTLWNM